MPQLTFRGASVRYFDTRQSPNGEALFVRVHMSADFTDTVRAAMEWQELPDSFSEAKLEGQLAAEKLSLRPDSKQMLKLGFDLAIKELRDFKLVRLVEDNHSRLDLRFVVVTSQDGAYTMVGDFLRTCGKETCQMKVTYTEQTLIDDSVKATEEQRQAVLAEQ